MPFRPAQRSEFSRAPLQASTARGPRAAGRDHRVAFSCLLPFGEANKVGRLPGRIPGLVMTTVQWRWVIRRNDVTAKQQLLLKLPFVEKL